MVNTNAIVAFVLPLPAVLALGLLLALALRFGALPAYILTFAFVVTVFVLSSRLSASFLLASMFFQYFWIGALISPSTSYQSIGDLTANNAFVIYTTFLCSLAHLGLRWRSLSREIRTSLIAAGAFVAVVCAYAALGLTKTSFDPVFAYTKAYSGAFLFLAIGASYGLRLRLPDFLAICAGFGLLLALYGYLEFAFPFETYTFVHMLDWLHYKYSFVTYSSWRFHSIYDVVNFFTVDFLNLSGQFGINLPLIRPVGPVFHFINFAYALSFCLLAAVVTDKKWIVILLLPILVLVGSKGAIALTAFPLIAIALRKWTNSKDQTIYKGVCALLVFYIGLVLSYGYLSNDYHFLGLSAGLRGFLSNPLGHGTGIGGNGSEMKAEAVASGADFQTGNAFVAESAIFVLLYQLGLPGIILLLVFWRGLASKTLAWVSASDQNEKLKRKMFVLPIALWVILANGIFQEEAFSPHAWGLWLLLTGLALGGKTYRILPNQHTSDATLVKDRVGGSALT